MFVEFEEKGIRRMKVIVYVIPILFSGIMLINGAIRYWGFFDKESMEAIFYHYMPSKREERNWKLSQKIYGKNLFIAGILNVITEVVLIPVVNWMLEITDSSDHMPIGVLLIIFLPSFIYMFGAWLLMQLKLKQLEDTDNNRNGV